MRTRRHDISKATGMEVAHITCDMYYSEPFIMEAKDPEEMITVCL